MNRQAMQDLERGGHIKVVEYDPSREDDLVRNFHGHDVVCIIPPIIQHGKKGGGEEDEDDEADNMRAAHKREVADWLHRCGKNMIEACCKAKIQCAVMVSVFKSESAGEDGGHHRGGTRGKERDSDSEGDQPGGSQLIKIYHQLEQCFKRTKIPHTCLVKVGLLMQTFLWYAPQVQDTGTLPLATGDGKFAPVSVRDVSRFMACLLSGKKRRGSGAGQPDRPGGDWKAWFTLDGWVASNDAAPLPLASEHHGKAYCLTGCEQVNGKQLVERANKAIGANIKHKDVGLDEARRLLEQHKEVHKAEMELLLEQYCLIQHGVYAHATRDFETITGRKPMTIEEFFADHASDFKPGRSA